jgi:hypothetical protein
MTDLVDQARERSGRTIFASWDEHGFEELVRLMRKSRMPSPTCRPWAITADRKSLSLTLFAGFISWCCHAGGPE